MESSANEALIIGVNLSIFIIATTIAIMLLTTVMDLSDLANESVITTTTGSVTVDGASVGKRVVTGSELMGYYTNYINKGDALKIWLSATTSQDLGDYLRDQQIKASFLRKQFELTLSGVDNNGKETYLFKAI